MNSTRSTVFALSRAGGAACPIGWIAMSGMASSARVGAVGDSCSASSRKVSTSAASTPASTRATDGTRGLGRARVRVAFGPDPNLSRAVAVGHAGACCFSTPGWDDHARSFSFRSSARCSSASRAQNRARAVALGFNALTALLALDALAELRPHGGRPAVRRTPRLDPSDRRRIPRRHRWLEPAACLADLARRPVRVARATR